MQTATQPEAAFAAAARAQASKIMTGSLRWPALVLAWMSFAIAKVDASEPDHAVLWTGSMTPARAAYESEVIKLALERSRDEYGPFTFSASDKLLSTERLERLIQQGEMVNVVSSPVWDLESGGHSVLQVLPYPISKGLLGYRELVVRRDALPLFASIRTVEQLRELTAGLGNNWTELDVFQASNLHWYGGRDIPQLLSMLSRGRIDYVPLGTMEVREALNDSQHRDQLAIVPGLSLIHI